MAAARRIQRAVKAGPFLALTLTSGGSAIAVKSRKEKRAGIESKKAGSQPSATTQSSN
jgi:hypothetical protein